MNRTFSVAIMVASVVLTFTSTIAAELEPLQPDTLWTRTTAQIPRVSEFVGNAMGGNPRVLIAGTLSGDLMAFDAMTGDTLRRVKSQLGSIYNISFARSANVFSTTSPYRVKIWRWPEMDVIREIRLPGKLEDPNSYRHVQATLTSDGKRIVVACYNRSNDTLHSGLYDVETGDQIYPISAAPHTVPQITADDRFVLTISNEPEVRDLTSGQLIATFPDGFADISEDGRYVCIRNRPGWERDGSLDFYDMVERRRVAYRVLPWKEFDGASQFSFDRSGHGFFLSRMAPGKIPCIEYYSTFLGLPVARIVLTYFTCRFSSDWLYSYGAGGTTAFVSRVNFDLLLVATETNTQPDIIVVPNPSGGDVDVRGLRYADGPLYWTISDLRGSVVITGHTELLAGTCRISLPALPSSTYMLGLERDGTILTNVQIQR
ncbi:MAG TPA: hypothetical protein PLW14_09760 [Chlorobiota bacterium]|nr:hypothetical protein [Chlorobiota bacterium]